MSGQRVSNKQIVGLLQQLSNQFHFYLESHERMSRALESMTAKVDELLQQTQRAIAETKPVEVPEFSEDDDPLYEFLD